MRAADGRPEARTIIVYVGMADPFGGFSNTWGMPNSFATVSYSSRRLATAKNIIVR